MADRSNQVEAALAGDQELRSDSDFADRLFDAAPVMLLVVDAQGRILRANRHVEELTGCPLERLRGADWIETLIPPGQRPKAREFFHSLDTDSVKRATTPISAADGGEREIAWSGRALTDVSGTGAAVLLSGQDISRVRESHRRQLDKERVAIVAQMAAGLAHESRNALQQIGACAEMLTMELAGSREPLDLVQGIQEAEARLHRLFEDVRAYAAPLRLEFSRTCLLELCRRAWKDVIKRRGVSDCKLSEHIECSDTQCEVDRNCIEQAVAHLLENALDAALTDPRGNRPRIELHCREVTLVDRTAVSLEIVDTGPGLSDEIRARMFDPFFTTKTRGTGLGMSIARRVVDAHRGLLEVETRPAGGAQVRITLPHRLRHA